MTDSVRTYDIYYTHGTSDEIDAEGYRYIVKDDVSHEPLPSAVARVVFTRDDRPVLTVNASAVVSIRERTQRAPDMGIETLEAFSAAVATPSSVEALARRIKGDMWDRWPKDLREHYLARLEREMAKRAAEKWLVNHPSKDPED